MGDPLLAQALRRRLENAGLLDTGQKISAALARRLACEAGLTAAVIGGRTQVLDLGRTRRLFTRAQRLAIIIRQLGRCAAEGCDRRGGLHAHHRDPWASGGRTDLDNAVGLCHWHHNRAHDPDYDTAYHPSGAVTFHRRT